MRIQPANARNPGLITIAMSCLERGSFSAENGSCAMVAIMTTLQDWCGELDHTMPELIRRAAVDYGDQLFIVGEDDHSLTFEEFAQSVKAAARAFLARRIEIGDRVAIWAPNSTAWIVAACAIEMIGAVMVPINTRFRGGEAAYILAKSRAKLLCTVGSFLDNDYVAMLHKALGGTASDRPVDGLPDLEAILLIEGDTRRDGALSWNDFLQDLAPRADLLARERAVSPDTICDILFTSGTTGQPKGAVHAHGQALWMVGIWNRSNDLQRGDRALIVNPFFHSFGYRSGWVSALLAGMTVYPMAVFDADAMLRQIEANRISVLMGPPTLFYAILDHPHREQFDLSSLRVGHTGSANVPVDLIARAREELGFDIFLTSYGLTEATALVSVNYPQDDFETIARTVGRALPGTGLKVIAPEGHPLATGEAGELLVRGPNVMQGYFEDPEATSAAIDQDGWLHTGDVATIDETGMLRILDRLKEVVIVGGFNVYPAEVENFMLGHPAIEEVAIIAVPDERMGEVCGACVVLREGQKLSLADLSAWARTRMANFKVPRHLFVRDSLPRTPLGKVQKFRLRKEALAELDGQSKVAPV
jgi:acyl-CoA synthetase (AMP-forming)/AMP-acid ligase II